jgi:hypothetical protein
MVINRLARCSSCCEADFGKATWEVERTGHPTSKKKRKFFFFQPLRRRREEEVLLLPTSTVAKRRRREKEKTKPHGRGDHLARWFAPLKKFFCSPCRSNRGMMPV